MDVTRIESDGNVARSRKRKILVGGKQGWTKAFKCNNGAGVLLMNGKKKIAKIRTKARLNSKKEILVAVTYQDMRQSKKNEYILYECIISGGGK